MEIINYANAFRNLTNNVRDLLTPFGESLRSDQKESFSFIPGGFIPEALKNVLNDLKKTHPRRKVFKFVDLGCGIGNIVIMAEAIGFKAYGVENDPRLENLKKQSSWFKFEDIMETDLNEYDVLYFYRPFQNYKFEDKFEKRIMRDMKVGAYIYPLGEWPVNKKYFEDYPSYRIYKKIKEFEN
jgi:hypothetical protein